MKEINTSYDPVEVDPKQTGGKTLEGVEQEVTTEGNLETFENEEEVNDTSENVSEENQEKSNEEMSGETDEHPERAETEEVKDGVNPVASEDLLYEGYRYQHSFVNFARKVAPAVIAIANIMMIASVLKSLAANVIPTTDVSTMRPLGASDAALDQFFIKIDNWQIFMPFASKFKRKETEPETSDKTEEETQTPTEKDDTVENESLLEDVIQEVDDMTGNEKDEGEDSTFSDKSDFEEE